MPIPTFEAFMRPLLELASDGKIYELHATIDIMADQFGMSEEERNQLQPSGTAKTFNDRVGWAITYLVQAGLLERPRRATVQITDAGRQALATHTGVIDKDFLRRYPQFREFQSRARRSAAHDDPATQELDLGEPEEQGETQVSLVAQPETAIPPFQELMRPVLELAGDGATYGLHTAVEKVGDRLNLSEAERQQLLPSGARTIIYDRVAWVVTDLVQAGLLERPRRAAFRITDEGRQVLAEHHGPIDRMFLRRYPAFREFLSRRRTSNDGDDLIAPEDYSDDEPTTPPPTLDAISAQTGIGLATLELWVRALRRRGQAILCGEAGSGKTLLATLLAQHIAAGGPIERVHLHPAWSYADFVQAPYEGPDAAGEPERQYVDGVALRFLKAAGSGPAVLIVEDMHRADIPAVFGELLALLDARDQPLRLASGAEVILGRNVVVLGTLDSAASAAFFGDAALRRRFPLLSLDSGKQDTAMYPEFQSHTMLQVILNEINQQIRAPYAPLSPAAFAGIGSHEELEEVWRLQIEPYLRVAFGAKSSSEQFSWYKVKRRLYI